MSDIMFHIFSDSRFLDLTIYQYGYEKCEPLHSYGPHIRNHYLFHYVISGRGRLMVDHKNTSTEYVIDGGSGFLIEPDCINTYYADQNSPWEYVWVEFDGLRVHEFMEEAGLSSKSPIFFPTSPEAGKKVCEEMMHIVTHHLESSLHQIGHLYLFLDALIEGSSSKKYIQGGKLSKFYSSEALTYIAQNYDKPITVEDLAKICNLNRSYFSKMFKETVGQSPQEFLIQYRMLKAGSLLVTTTLSINEIGTLVGYPNQLHFSRAFKKVYGISPRTYRQNYKLKSQS
jgi:AraC-like DNA-binding protein